MKRLVMKLVLSTLVAGMSLPLAAQAADDDLQMKIDKLTKEVQDLKGSVQRVEGKSLGKWLTIGGDYRFRVDSLYGETVGYTSAPAFMGALQRDPSTMGFFATPAAQGLLSSTAYGAVAGLTPNAMMGNLVNYMANTPGNPFFGNPAGAGAYLQNTLGAGAFVPAFKPKNQTLYTNKFGLELGVKATQDVTVHAKLDMYKAFGSQTDATTMNGYFADRVACLMAPSATFRPIAF